MIYFEALAQAAQMLIQPYHIALLFIGISVGAVVGILPGMGGVVGMSVLIPFIWGLDTLAIPPLLMGMLGILRTIDTFPAVLFSMPGTSGSQATMLDGYALAKKGEAGRALGASYMASMTGGIIGALSLILVMPIVRPLILLCRSPEFFMFCLLGVTMVGVLSGRRPVKGITTGLLGMLLATIGGAPGVSILRYTFDIPYLYNGIPMVIVALGLFAIPEIVFVTTKGTSISDIPQLAKGAVLRGVREALDHIWIILRCAAMGTYIGILPGLGAAVANWFAYGHIAQVSRNRENFGKGDIRGVIAPESANNAADGGSIIPTLFFGIPGSATMAVFLSSLMVLGINPGPDMITKNLPFVFMIVFSLALANIMGAILCLIFTKPICRLTTVPIHILIPFILMAVILASYQSTRHWGDLIALLLFSILGYFMKMTQWPRPTLLIGFVLGSIAERYLWISLLRYGAGWLLDPSIIIIGLFTIVSVMLGLRGQKRTDIGNRRSIHV